MALFVTFCSHSASCLLSNNAGWSRYTREVAVTAERTAGGGNLLTGTLAHRGNADRTYRLILPQRTDLVIGYYANYAQRRLSCNGQRKACHIVLCMPLFSTALSQWSGCREQKNRDQQQRKTLHASLCLSVSLSAFCFSSIIISCEWFYWNWLILGHRIAKE